LSLQLPPRALAAVCLAAAFALVAVDPALAQTTGGTGGNLGTFIQNIINLLNNNIIRGLAIIAIIVTGIAWMFGHLDLRRAGTVIIGIIVIFGAATIVDLITGGSSGTGG
jgi:type IV secretory pathway VirB2 component (pilin)